MDDHVAIRTNPCHVRYSLRRQHFDPGARCGKLPPLGLTIAPVYPDRHRLAVGTSTCRNEPLLNSETPAGANMGDRHLLRPPTRPEAPLDSLSRPLQAPPDPN